MVHASVWVETLRALHIQNNMFTLQSWRNGKYLSLQVKGRGIDSRRWQDLFFLVFLFLLYFPIF